MTEASINRGLLAPDCARQVEPMTRQQVCNPARIDEAPDCSLFTLWAYLNAYQSSPASCSTDTEIRDEPGAEIE